MSAAQEIKSDMRKATLALSLLAASPSMAEMAEIARSDRDTMQMVEANTYAQTGEHLLPSSTIGDLLRNKAFEGFAPLLLPWDDRVYDDRMRLDEMAALLPYHTHFDPAVAIRALNRMIDDVSMGSKIFYDFYSEAQQRDQPAKQKTGLFFFRGKPGAPFAIIAPGGGFAYVGSIHEGFPFAAQISDYGYNAFVLKYRAGSGERAATEDLAAALSYIVQNARQLEVDIQNYSLWGSSAGARMVATIGSHGAARFGGSQLPKPSVVVMAYTGHSDYSRDEPATFVVVGEQDRIAPPSAMERRIAALRSGGTEVEYRKYRGLGHGFGPGSGTEAQGWISEATLFWERVNKNIKDR